MKTVKIIPQSIPTLFTDKEECCGCGACFAACPRKAISLLPDEEGFLYPVIDKKRCIRCGNCLTVCAFREEQKKSQFTSKESIIKVI